MSHPHDFEKKYYELRALFTLRELYPVFKGSLVHGDKPDLIDQNNNIGIEVTRVTDEFDEKKSSFYEKYIRDKLISDISDDVIEKFETDGYDILTYPNENNENYVIGYGRNWSWHNNNNVKSSVKKKINKLNVNSYTKTSRNMLYVFSDSFREYEENDMREIVAFAIDYQEKMEMKYSVLYFDDCGWFYECDLNTGNINFINTEQILHSICENAKNIAERNENGNI